MPKKTPNLLPPQTGGKLFLPGYHRTRQESGAASIILDSLRADKLRGGSLYGKGFYMTRTYMAQRKTRMVSNYGPHLVKTRVDISRFICFDQSVARRVWGENHTLEDQLAGLPYAPQDRAFIKKLSDNLSLFWEKKKGFYTTRFGGKTPRIIQKSSDVAQACYHRLRFERNVPGIVYTGKSDGPCVVAYELSRVTPLAMAKDANDIHKIKDLTWINAKDPRLMRSFNPHKVLVSDSKTYETKLKSVPVMQRKETILHHYKNLAKDPFDQLAFAMGLLRATRAASLEQVCTDVMTEIIPIIHPYLKIDVPFFSMMHDVDDDDDGRGDFIGSVNNMGVKSKHYEPNRPRLASVHVDHRKHVIQILSRYKDLWDYLRYAVMKDVAIYHSTRVLADFKQALVEIIKKPTNPALLQSRLQKTLMPVFGGWVNKYAEFSSIRRYVGDKEKNNRMNEMYVDGFKLVSDRLRGIRNEYGEESSVRKNSLIPTYYDLIGIEEYEQFIRGQILRLYDVLIKDPDIMQHEILVKTLKTWYRKYGRDYRKQVKAYPAYLTIDENLWKGL